MSTLLNFTVENEHGKKIHTKQPSIESLPDECLFEIFRRLTGQERSVSACVSKHWLDLLTTVRKCHICNTDLNGSAKTVGDGCSIRSLEFYQKKIRLLEEEKTTDIKLLAIAVGTSTIGGLSKLSIYGSSFLSGVTDFGIAGIARASPDLKSLSLWNVSCVSDKGLFELAKWCPLLENLDLSLCPLITRKGLIAIAENCPNLSSLEFDSYSRIENEGLQAISERCSKLEKISIKDCPLIGDQGIASLSSCSSLTELKLNGLSISDLSLSVIGRFGKSIVHLSLTDINNVGEKGFCIMGNRGGLQSLVSLMVDSCSGVTDLSIESIAKGCINLKQISLKKCGSVSDLGLLAFSMSAASVESLHLEEVNKITLYGIISALSVIKSKLRNLSIVSCVGLKDIILGDVIIHGTSCRSVRSLSIRNCPDFGSSGLTILGKLCPEVSQLSLNGLTGITDEGVISFLDSSGKDMVKVDFHGCLNVCDEAIERVVINHGKTMIIMNFEGCRKLTDSSLFAISQHCEQLKELYMSYCAITDEGIAKLASAEKIKLEVLLFMGCHGLSDECAKSFIRMQESLDRLSIKYCSSISSRTFQKLEGMFRRAIGYV